MAGANHGVDFVDATRAQLDPRSARVNAIDAVDFAHLGPAQMRTFSNDLAEPLLMRNLCRDATSKNTWSLERMLELDPDREVTVEHYPDGDRRKPYERVTKPFRELAGPMTDEPEKWFIAERDFDREFPKVAAELPRLSVIPADARELLRLVFFGTNSQSATHFHVMDQAILTHLRGHKRVILTAPHTTDRLATNSAFGGRPQFSTHGPDAGGDALDYFTDLVGPDEVMFVDLAPGDALFIPVHWWHWAEGYGENLSVTSFWRASLRHWAFPHPGIRAANAVLLGKTATAVRAAGQRVGIG